MKFAFVAFALFVARTTEAWALPAFQDAQTREQISVDKQVQNAKVIQQTAPEYPALARQTRIEGTVRLEAIIAKNGKVKELKVLWGHPLLIQSALNAVRQWRYAPTLLNGKRVEVRTEIDVIYSLVDGPHATAPISPDEGFVSEGQYSNKFFRLTYSIPKGWTAYDPEAMAELSKSSGHILSRGDPAEEEKFEASARRTYKLLMLSQYPLGTVGKDVRVIQIVAVRLPDASEIRSGRDHLLNLKRVAQHLNGPVQFSGEPYEVWIAGKEFFRLDGQGTSPEGLLYQAAISTVLQGYALNFVFTSPGQADLESLCKTLESLHFEDQAH